MPLIIVTGLPCSGKSNTAELIHKFFEQNLTNENDSRKVRIVTDGDNLDWDGRDNIYMSVPKEKELRGWLRAEVQRYVNLGQVVILDAAVYIKGFRYELHCLSKEAKTQYCIVEKFLNKDICWKWNEARIEDWLGSSDRDKDEPSPGYNRETFEALVMRYEKCDETNRWDSPLFRVTSEDKNQVPLREIYQAITRSEPLAPNKSTTTLMSTTTMYNPPR